MTEYVGKVCPFCKTPFTETDDIVICSSCDMPHHKECWIENQGCTTFGCMGTIKGVSNERTSVTTAQASYEPEFDIASRPVYCGSCGAANNAENNFCEKCGQTLAAQKSGSPEHTHFSASTRGASGYVSQPNYPSPTIEQQPQYSNQYSVPSQSQYYQIPHAYSTNPQEESAFIGESYPYYIGKFSELRSEHKNTSWNWSAFVFGGSWLAYRKMYGYAAGYAAATALISFLGTLGAILNIALIICSGIFGNYLYMKYVEKNLQEEAVMMEPAKSQHRTKYGGTSVLGVVLFCAIVAVVNSLLQI